MIEHVCLEALLNISRHPRLSLCIQDIEIDSHVFPESASDEDSIVDRNFYLDRLRRGHIPRSTLIDTGQACHMLTEAFANFPNLRRIDIDRSQTRSWGRSYSKHPGNHFPEDTDSCLLPQMVISALAEACARPNTIGIHLKQAWPDSLTSLVSTKVRDMINKLDVFIIRLDRSDKYWEILGCDPDDNYISAELEASLRRFMHQLTSLTYLELSFGAWNPLPSSFLAWLGGISTRISVPLDEYIPTVEMRTLKRLHIRGAKVEPAALLAVCLRLELSGLSLIRVSIARENLADDYEDCWRVFLKKLSVALVSRQFEYMTLMQVGQYIGAPGATSTGYERTNWVPDCPDPRNPNDIHICTGYRAAETSESISQWLECAAGRTRISKRCTQDEFGDPYESSSYSTEDDSDDSS